MKARVRQKFDIFEGIDDYHLGFYQNIPSPCLKGRVGKLLNHYDRKIHIDMIIDNEYMQESNGGPCIYHGDHENVLNSAIVMTTEFFEIFRNNHIHDCVFWHEAGHFHTFRYFENKHDQNGSANKIRGEYIKRGEILPEEKAADLFALYYTSKEKMAIHFDLAIAEHLDDEGEVLPWHEMIVEELWLRKEYIENVGNSKEDILKELCKVCGVEYNPPEKR